MVPDHLSDEEMLSNNENHQNKSIEDSDVESPRSILSHSESSMPSNLSSCSSSESINNSDCNLLESEQTHNTAPINLSERDNVQMYTKSFVPRVRTVPCVVLSQNNEQFNPSLLSVSPTYCLPPSPLESIMTKISKLSSPDSSYFNRIFTGNLPGKSDDSEDLSKANNDQKDLNSDKNEPKRAFRKLSFGIDRILSDDFANKQDEKEPGNKFKDQDPLIQNHHHHQPNNLSHCSECFILSRFYRYQISDVGRNCPTSSWSQNAHIFEPSGSLLSPGGGYTHHQHSPLPQFGVNFSGYTSISPMVSCNTHSNPRRKRSWSRAVFSNLQRKGLEKRFQIQKYITKPDRRQLAATLGLTDAQVKVWFQNRRMKWRHTKEGKSGIAAPCSSSNTNYNTKSNQPSSSSKK